MEEDYKLRIFLYGKKALNDIKYLSKNLDNNIKTEIKNKQNVYIIKDTKYNYEFYVIEGELSESKNKIIESYLKEHYQNENMIKANELIEEVTKKYMNEINNYEIDYATSRILKEFRQFFDILVICVDKLNSKDSKLVFKFFQGFTNINAQQPFIYFLTKFENHPNITELFEYNNNEFFDRRNVFAFKFPRDDKELEILNNQFIKCKNYYNEINADDINNASHTFNIAVCGPAGSGKSTFINYFFRDKVSKEGEGLSVTHKITNYIHPDYPIKLFDTPGFEDDFTVKIVEKFIDNLINEKYDNKNHLELILYICNLKERNFYANEIDFIKFIITKNIKIIFILNDSSNNKDSEVKRLFDITQQSLSKIFDLNSLIDKDKKEELKKNIILLRIKQRLYFRETGDDNCNIQKRVKIINQGYGMDTLFKRIYCIFEKYKISYSDICINKDIKEIWKIMEKYEILSKMKEIKDHKINIYIKCLKLILSFCKKENFKSEPEKVKIIEFLKELNKILDIKLEEDLDKKYYDIMKKIYYRSIDSKNIISLIFNFINEFKENFINDNFSLVPKDYNEFAILVVYIYIEQINNYFWFNFESSKKEWNNYCISLNNAINGIQKMSLEWSNVYNFLIKDKIPAKYFWIKKLFMRSLSN